MTRIHLCELPKSMPERRLVAILSADVQGYSRLMRENETATIRTLTAYRWVMGRLIKHYRGRVVDDPGDNLLAEFPSVVEAVQCAVAIQRTLAERNATLPARRRMVFRMGLHLGDVVVEQGRLYGEEVNLAARIERLAEGGGICISGTVYDHIVRKLPLRYIALGEWMVKHVPTPVRIYRVPVEPRVLSRQEDRGPCQAAPAWRRLIEAVRRTLWWLTTGGHRRTRYRTIVMAPVREGPQPPGRAEL